MQMRSCNAILLSTDYFSSCWSCVIHFAGHYIDIQLKMFSIHFKCLMNCSSRLATLTKRDEHFNEHCAMKRRQRRSKKLQHAHSYGFAGFMRKIGIEHGNDEN